MKFILRWLVRIIILVILFGNCIPAKASDMNWTVIKEDVKGQNFDVELKAAANEEGEYTKYGIKLWDDEGNLVYENNEGVFSPTADLKVWYNLSGLQCYSAFCMVPPHLVFNQIKIRYIINYSDREYIRLIYAVPFVLS